jgi:uncharacterized protein YycO
MRMSKTKNRNAKRTIAIILSIVVAIFVILGGLSLGCVIAEKSWVHWRPNYEKMDIQPLLDKEVRTEEDYRVLYAQTGLTKLGIDDLLAENNKARILLIQEAYFSNFKVHSSNFAPFTYTEYIDGLTYLTTLREGDILVSARMRVSFMRFGHSALVVDPKNGVVLEAVSPGSVSEFASVAPFEESACFMVLRPKLSKEKKSELVAYAKKSLVGVKYKISVGILSKKYDAKGIKASHCSHLVWYAYKKFGVDLDATGGLVVTPRDMARSSKVELVQVYGYNPTTLWN